MLHLRIIACLDPTHYNQNATSDGLFYSSLTAPHFMNIFVVMRRVVVPDVSGSVRLFLVDNFFKVMSR